MTKRTFFKSGKIYSKVFDSTERAAFPTFASDTTMTAAEAAALKAYIQSVCVAANQIGYLKGGCSITITADKTEDQSDLGEMKVSIIQKETGTVTFGLFNANTETIAKQYPTATYAKNDSAGVEMVQVGGIENIDDNPHLIIFEHLDNANGNQYAILIGKNMSGFENAWKQDAVTPFQCQFTAEPYNNKGRFYMLVELNNTSTPAPTPVTAYILTSDSTIDSQKTYYTISGSTATPVAEPDVSDIATYYEQMSVVLTSDTTVNNSKTYYTKSGIVLTEVVSPTASGLPTYYEAAV